MKIVICENISKIAFYKTVEINGIKTHKFHIDSPTKYMLFGLEVIKQYTNIEVDLADPLAEFNMLNKSNVINHVTEYIPERELKEFKMILDMV